MGLDSKNVSAILIMKVAVVKRVQEGLDMGDKGMVLDALIENITHDLKLFESAPQNLNLRLPQSNKEILAFKQRIHEICSG